MKKPVWPVLTSLFLLSACATAPNGGAAFPSELNGEWKLVSFICEGGSQDKTVQLAQRGVAEGLDEETLKVSNGVVNAHSVSWTDAKKSGSCAIDRRVTWEVHDKQYRVLNGEVTHVQSSGTGKCTASKDIGVTGTFRPYRITAGQLGLFLSAVGAKKSPPPSTPGAYVACDGGNWVRNYRKLN
jgi:hypothetical protein